MICPNCSSDNTRTIDSRQFDTYRRRRYECLDCGDRFTTREEIAGEKIELNCIDCKNKDGRLFDALESIVSYNGHYEWLKDLRDELEKVPDIETYPMPDITWHTETHTIWMLLIGMFGDWGTSIRRGWIEDIKGCIEFIDHLCEERWKEN